MSIIMIMNVDFIYPVGSIYITTSSISPATLFGGTWERIKGRCIVGVDENDTDFSTVSQTGGNKNLQKHNHSGWTGSGYVHSMRVVAGTMVIRNLGNHMGSSGNGGISDLNESWDMPGGSHIHPFTTDEAGSGDSGNLQPYYTAYIWRRTA